MAQTPEGKVKDKIKKFLKERGVWFYMPVQNGMGVVGIPDLICCYRGIFLAIETKAPGKVKNTTPNQDARIAEINGANGIAIVCDCPEHITTLINAADTTLKLHPTLPLDVLIRTMRGVWGMVTHDDNARIPEQHINEIVEASCR